MSKAQPTSPPSAANRFTRFCWGIVWAVLFRCSPRPLHGWRRMLLRLFGANIHRTASIYPSARVWLPANLTMHEGACIADEVDVYCVAAVTIGRFATVSQKSYLCAASHDFDVVEHPLTVAPIVIGPRAWVAADVFIAPGVTVGEGTVVGARSAVFGDLQPWKVCVGTPAAPVRDRKIGPGDFDD